MAKGSKFQKLLIEKSSNNYSDMNANRYYETNWKNTFKKYVFFLKTILLTEMMDAKFERQKIYKK